MNYSRLFVDLHQFSGVMFLGNGLWFLDDDFWENTS